LTSASSFIRPWQAGQARTSTAKVRGGSLDELRRLWIEVARAALPAKTARKGRNDPWDPE
jgi:hypothetical protein